MLETKHLCMNKKHLGAFSQPKPPEGAKPEETDGDGETFGLSTATRFGRGKFGIAVAGKSKFTSYDKVVGQ